MGNFVHIFPCTISSQLDTIIIRYSADIAVLLLSTHRGGAWGVAWMSGYQNGRNFAWVGKGAPVTTFPHEVILKYSLFYWKWNGIVWCN